jgi:flavin reductase (DIM6/NTAB) family NADH-FMN oxidoreductase RutF
MLFDFESLGAQERYKLLLATVMPRPIAWVTTRDANNRINAAPFSFFNVFAAYSTRWFRIDTWTRRYDARSR